jgi:type II secretory pathway pseudopilin PulG
MRLITPRPADRAGFTLVEVLVAAALCIFIMVILTTAFTTGLQAFRELKAIGDMQEKMRAVTIVMRRDLASSHFEYNLTAARVNGSSLGQLRLNDPNWEPPDRGYFRIYQGSRPVNFNDPSVNTARYVVEGQDGDGLIASRATDHALLFTVKLPGYGRTQKFSTQLAPGILPNPSNPPRYSASEFSGLTQDQKTLVNASLREVTQGDTELATQWGEVSYFLEPSGMYTGFPAQTGNQLYTLVRRSRTVLPTGSQITWNATREAQAPDVSWSANTGRTNTPDDLTNPDNRLGGRLSTAAGGLVRIPATYGQYGDDILMTDVLSFQVKVHWEQAVAGTGGGPTPTAAMLAVTAPRFLTTARNGTGSVSYTNSDFPFDDLPAQGQNTNFQRLATGTEAAVFDTWTKAATEWNYGWDGVNPAHTNAVPLRVRVKALKITVRVWNRNIKQARQMTFIQDV